MHRARNGGRGPDSGPLPHSGVLVSGGCRERWRCASLGRSRPPSSCCCVPSGVAVASSSSSSLSSCSGFSACSGVEDPHPHPAVSALFDLDLDVLGMAVEGDPVRRRLHETGPAALMERCQLRTVRSVRATYELNSLLVVRYFISVSFPRLGFVLQQPMTGWIRWHRWSMPMSGPRSRMPIRGAVGAVGNNVFGGVLGNKNHEPGEQWNSD